VEFTKEEVRIFLSHHSTPDLLGTRKGNAWFVMMEPIRHISPTYDSSCAACYDFPSSSGRVTAVWGDDPDRSKGSWVVWHARLGHLGLKALHHLQRLAGD
jgi:hypothetical protein